MGLPYFQIRPLTKKNLAERLNVEATMNMIKLTSNAPADTVNTLNGIGVNPAHHLATTMVLGRAAKGEIFF